LLQLIDLKIAGYLHTQPGPAKMFGFFAARDRIEPLRNYVYRRGIDNYETVPVNRKMVIWFTYYYVNSAFFLTCPHSFYSQVCDIIKE
jgi:hypothetical protein